MDTFAYHPPSLSLSPAQPHPHHHPHAADDPATAAAAAAFAARPGSSSGAGPSTGFTQTLPPLQEHVSSESVPTTAAGGRPTLVGFEQLTGEDPHVGPSRAAYGASGDAHDGVGAHSLAGGFRDPFPGSSSSAAAAAAVNPYAQAPHAHSFFNPHPNVNMRNTRPMTAPSGPSYFNSPSYSAAPSAFYAPALQQQQHPHQQQHTSANAASTYGALDLAPPPPPLGPPGSSHGHSTFQYSVDTSPNLDYDAFRARGFSLPDMAGASGTSDPAGPDSASPTSSSTPFFYTPPSITPGSTLRTLQPAPPPPPHGEGYYPAVLDPAQALMPAPLAASTSAILPPASDLPPPPAAFLQQQRPQMGPTPSTRRSSTGGGGGAGAAGGAAGKQYNFVQQAGQTSKRPRRRFDEIERMYNCDYPGCTKAYGTLNHLNSHKTMQKHGPKSTPAQFKEMRKAWRERKKAEAASAARDRAAQPQPPPAPPSALGPPPSAGSGALPNALGLPPHLNDRPRPSTSAGEYHFSMPAPFMTPLGAPMLAYPPPPPAAVPQQAPQGMFDAPLPHPHAPPHGYDGDAATAAASGFGLHDVYGGGGASASAMRPVTAPSYYVAPQFGSSMPSSGLSAHPLAQPPTSTGSYVPPRLVSGQAGAAAFGVGSGAMGGDRRFSLPSSSLGYGPPPSAGTAWHSPQQDAIKRFYRQQYQREQEQELQQQQQHDAQQQQQQQQQPATTLEMPRPVLAGPNGYSALIHGGVTAAQVGAGAEGGAGKLGGEDGGPYEEIAAQ